MSISQKVAGIAAAKKKKAKKVSFIQQMKEEMKRVSWTTKEELFTCTKIVITAIFVLGLGIYLIDLIIQFVINGIGGLARLIGG